MAYLAESDAAANEAIAVQNELFERLGEFSLDPLGFVLWAFPWGDPNYGLGPVGGVPQGPEKWQRDFLDDLGKRLRAGYTVQSSLRTAIRKARRSGHGIGKSALVAWLVLWAISTCELTRGVVTANTDTQLRTKTWPEVHKWYGMFVAKDLFKVTATAIFSSNPEFEKNWRIDAVPWSDTNTAAFAGLHNKGRRIIMIFDEASEISRLIFETAEGVCTDTDTEIIFACFGNQTVTDGAFADCFGKFRHRWECDSIDSRLVSFTNKAEIQQWLDDYGEDSDFFRVRVRGLPPRAGSTAFIAPDLITAARRREIPAREYGYYPVLIGVDVARFGDDQTVITVRQGPMVHEQRKYRGLPTDQVAARSIDTYRKWNAARIFVDGIGVGAGVVDQISAANIPVTDVVVSNTATDDRKYDSLRSELWGRLRDLLPNMALPDDPELAAELEGMQYGFDPKMRVQLERKKDFKKRLGFSPDNADSLCLTFMPVLQTAPKKVQAVRVSQRRRVM